MNHSSQPPRTELVYVPYANHIMNTWGKLSGYGPKHIMLALYCLENASNTQSFSVAQIKSKLDENSVTMTNLNASLDALVKAKKDIYVDIVPDSSPKLYTLTTHGLEAARNLINLSCGLFQEQAMENIESIGTERRPFFTSLSAIALSHLHKNDYRILAAVTIIPEIDYHSLVFTAYTLLGHEACPDPKSLVDQLIKDKRIVATHRQEPQTCTYSISPECRDELSNHVLSLRLRMRSGRADRTTPDFEI